MLLLKVSYDHDMNVSDRCNGGRRNDHIQVCDGCNICRDQLGDMKKTEHCNISRYNRYIKVCDGCYIS